MNIATKIFKSSFQYFFCFSFPFLLSSCEFFETPPPPVKIKHVSTKPHYQANEYVEHLSLADILLANNAVSTANVAPHLKIIEDYSAGKQKKTIMQQVAVLTYTLKGKNEMQPIIAPVNMSAGADNSALLNVLNALNAMTYTLNDVRIAVLAVTPISLIKFKDSTPEQIKAELDRKLQAWLQKLEPLPPMEEVKAQMKLTRFFMDYHMRDFAYLSVENAKQMLAAASEKGIDPQAEKKLSQDLQQLESHLRETMPFTFNPFKN